MLSQITEDRAIAAGGVFTVFLAAGALLVFRRTDEALLAVSNRAFLNAEASYQLSALSVTIILLGVLALLSRSNLRSYFRVGKINAPVEPEPSIGLRPDEDETWLQVGLNFTVIITVVTAGVVWVSQFSTVEIGRSLLGLAPWVLLFAVINAFVEEVIFRLGVVVPLAGRLPNSHIALVSGAVFGGVHYFGTAPRGIAGLALAGFIGWFLAKAVLETGGLFWAWLIHFVQDVVLFGFIFGAQL